MSDSQLEETPVDRLHRQIQEFVNEIAEGSPELVDVAVVVFEVVWYDDEGDPQREVRYAATAHNASLSSTAGLFDIGREVLSSDIFDGDDD